MIKFQNPACYVILALFLAHCLNDLLSTPLIENIPVTPVQVTIFISIIYLTVKGKKLTSRVIKRVFVPAYLYFLVIVISTILTFIELKRFELYIITLGFNLFLLRFMAPHLEQGITASDLKKLIWILIYLFLFIVLLPGLYEFSFRTNLLSTQKGISVNVFYIRGLFTDKIEFGTILGLLIFILILLSESRTTTFGRIVILPIVFLAFVLTFFSFSSTALVGIISGVMVLFLYNVRGIFIKAFTSVLLLFIFYSLIYETPLFEEQVKSYRLKYVLNVERYDEKNFRYLSFVKGFDSFLENPFFGSGVSQSQVVIQQLLGTKKQINPHNILSTELIDYGLVGTLFLGIFLFRLYKLMFNNPFDYRQVPHLHFLQRLVVALGIFVLFRLILYYHRLDQTIYFLWAALLMGAYGTAIRTLKEEREKPFKS